MGFRFLTLFLVLLATANVTPRVVHAQSADNLPAFNIPPPMPLGNNAQNLKTIPPRAATLEETSELFSSNTHVGDLISLQYQLSLLQELIEWQNQIQTIANVYQGMGVSFPQPSPDREICSKLPANNICRNAYPELYNASAPKLSQSAGEELVTLQAELKRALEDRKSLIEKSKTQAPSTADPQLPQSPQQAEMQQPQYAHYYWTDLSCIGNDCKAVIIDSKRSTYAKTVRQGDRLGDNERVSKIDASGVMIMRGDQAVTIAPAPLMSSGDMNAGLDKVASSQKVARTAPSQANNSNTSNISSSDIAPEDRPNPPMNVLSTAPSGQVTESPSLGPTGLF